MPRNRNKGKGKVAQEAKAIERAAKALAAKKGGRKRRQNAAPVSQAHAGRYAMVPKLEGAARGAQGNFMADANKLLGLMDSRQKSETIAALKQALVSRGTHAPFPRAVPVDVSPCPIVLVKDLPYADLGTSDPRSGLAGIEVYPSLRVPLWEWTVASAAAQVEYELSVSNNTPYEGLWPTDGSNFDDAIMQDKLEISTDILNVVGLYDTTPVQGLAMGSMLRKFKASDGTYAYGLPIELSGANISVDLSVTPATGNFTASVNFQMRLVGTQGVTAWVTGTATGSDTPWWDSTFVFTGAQTSLGGRYACCLPDSPMGIQIRSNTGTYEVGNVALNFLSDSGATYCGMRPVQLDYFDDLGWVRKASIVGLQPWVQFVGSKLTASGQIASMSLPPGTPGPLDGFTGYQSIASTPASFNGPLVTGMYGVWRPFTLNDIAFHQKDDVAVSFTMASHVTWLKVGNYTEADSLKLYLLGMAEAQTRDPTRAVVRCRPNPLAETLVLGLLHGYPAATENPLHLKDIKEFLGRVGGIAREGVVWFNDNKHWIVPAATMAMTALAAL